MLRKLEDAINAIGWKTWTFILIVLIAMLPLVIGQQGPPAQSNLNLDLGLQIFYPDFSFVKQGQDFNLNIHVSNISDGTIIDTSTANCTLNLYNQTGFEQFEGNLTPLGSGGDYELFISGTNFSTIGHMAWRIYCGNGVGGTASGILTVTTTGFWLEEEQGTLVSLLVLGIFLIIYVLIKSLSVLPKGNNVNDIGDVISINNLKHLRPLIWGLIWTLITVSSYILSNLAFAYLPNQLLGTFFFTVFRILMVISPFIVIVWFIYLFVKLVEDKELRKYIENGVIGGGTRGTKEY